MDRPRVDGRTREAKSVAALEASLTINPTGTGKALLKRIVAVNETIAHAIYEHALNTDGLFDGKGKLNPLIERQFPKFQAAAKTALVELLKLEATTKPDGQPEDVFQDVFE